MQKLFLASLLVVAGTSATAAETIAYSYDALGRLISVSHSGAVNNAAQTTYSYDPADNRINVTTTGATH